MISALIKELKRLNVINLVVCPGGRNAKLVQALLRDSDFQIFSHYDERSASFFALGKSFENPTALVVTSGTAVSEAFSAVIEAYHQKDSQLVIISADRPRAYAGTGAPQSIVQKDIYKNYVRSYFEKSDLDSPAWELAPKYPMHINLYLGDPNPMQESPLASSQEGTDLGSLVLISELNAQERERIKKELSFYRGFLILECLSNLTAEDFPEALVLSHADMQVGQLSLKRFQGLIRLGGVPVSKVWREAEKIKTYYWDKHPFKGSPSAQALSLEKIRELLLEEPELSREWKKRLKDYDQKLEESFEKFPSSEIAQLKKLAQKIPEGSQIFLSNSLPIREWEWAKQKSHLHFGQRGVNGIDGTLAMALGRAQEQKENWILLGDLTALYNINDLSFLNQMQKFNINIIVVDNRGGQIFKKVIKEETDFFINPQNLDLAKIFEARGIKLTAFEDPALVNNKGCQICILDVSNEESEQLQKTIKDIPF